MSIKNERRTNMTNTEEKTFTEEILTDAETVLTLVKAFRYARTDELNFKPGDDDLLAGCAQDILMRMCSKLVQKTVSEENDEEE